MEAVEAHSLGQISHGLYEVGGIPAEYVTMFQLID